MDDHLWYFAYGSNLCRQIFAERRQLTARARRVGRLDGYRLCFDLPIGPGERGVANVCRDDTAHIWGALYLLSAEQCEHLDRTEGVPNGLYRRLSVQVLDTDGMAVSAFTYESSLRDPSRKPSPRYIGLILDGAVEHGLPQEYVHSLRQLELAHDERINEVI